MSFSDDIKKFVKHVTDNENKLVRKVVLDVATSLIVRSPVGNPEMWMSLGASYRFMNKAGTKRLKRSKLEFRVQPPKGYKGGHFRANWQLGVGFKPSGTIEGTDKSGRKTLGKILASLSTKPAAGVFYVSNNLPYGPALEDGHSKQAPHGFVALTKIEFQDMVAKATTGLK